MLTSLGTAMLSTFEDFVEAPQMPKLAPCSFWESKRSVECATDVGLVGYGVACELGKVYEVCQFNWWLVGGIGVAALLLLGNR